MKVFNFSDYKKFVLAEIKSRPHGGHGEFRKIAKALNVHSTMVTHVFKASLQLSIEQSLALAEYLGLNGLETEYFLALVHFARAGDERTRAHFKSRLKRLKEKSMSVGARLESKNTLDEGDQAFFYSSWIYAAIRLLSAVPAYQSRDMIAETLELPRARLNRALEFLISRGLCVENGNKILYGNKKTFVSKESPLAARHHANWRLKIVSQLDRLTEQDLAFTYPTVISAEDFLKLREELVQFLERFKKTCDSSPSEKLYCLNIDWVEVISRVRN